MNRDIGFVLRPLVALLLFALVALQTVGALRDSGAWNLGVHARPTAVVDPLAGLEAALAERPAAPLPPNLRDPFALGATPAPVAHAKPGPHQPAPAPPAPKPVLTAIVWDADPRALVHWKGRDWTVRPGMLFDEFQVTTITRDQVTLVRGTDTFVLQHKPQGD